MKKKLSGLSGLLMCVMEIVVGILLLINPHGFITGIILAFGGIVAVVGLIRIIRYFATPAAEAAQGGDLASGLLMMLLGGFCAIYFTTIFGEFAVILVGLIILVSAAFKLQSAVDMMRGKQKGSFMALLTALVTAALGALVAFNPFGAAFAIWTFIAIALLVEAGLDLFAFIFSKIKDKKQEAPADEEETKED